MVVIAPRASCTRRYAALIRPGSGCSADVGFLLLGRDSECRGELSYQSRELCESGGVEANVIVLYDVLLGSRDDARSC